MPIGILMIALALVHVIWGGGFIVIKVAQESFAIEQILLGRVVLASVLYLALWRIIPKPTYQKGDWKPLLLLALCEPFLLFSFETFGLKYTSASQGGMIVACVPLTVAIGAYLIYKESISKLCLTGIVCAVGGVFIVSAFGGPSEHAPNPLLGNILIFCAVLSATCYALTVKHLCTRYHFMFLSAIQVFGATVLFLPGALSAPIPDNFDLNALWSILYLGLGITFLVYFVINYALTRIKASQVILFSNLIPVSTLVLAYLILNEELAPIQYAGVALVLVGVLLASRIEKNSQVSEKSGEMKTGHAI